MYRERYNPDFVHFCRNFSVENYARVLNRAACIVGNSSSGIREASFLGVPAVNIGSRQDGRERASNVVDVAYNGEQIREAIYRQLRAGRYPRSTLFGDGTAGQRIAQILSEAKIVVQKKLHY